MLADSNERMRSLGWRFDRPTVVKDWWRDLGTRKQVYCKDDMEAHLTFGPDQEDFFDIVWSVGASVGLPVTDKECWAGSAPANVN